MIGFALLLTTLNLILLGIGYSYLKKRQDADRDKSAKGIEESSKKILSQLLQQAQQDKNELAEKLHSIDLKLLGKSNSHVVNAIKEDFDFYQGSLDEKQIALATEIAILSDKIKNFEHRIEAYTLTNANKDNGLEDNPPGKTPLDDNLKKPERPTDESTTQKFVPNEKENDAATVLSKENNAGRTNNSDAVLDNVTPLNEIITAVEKSNISRATAILVSDQSKIFDNTVQDWQEVTISEGVSLDEYIGSPNEIEYKYLPSKIEVTSYFQQLSLVKNYPIVTMPHDQKDVLQPIEGRKNAKGIGEQRFKTDILKRFSSRIKTNLVLPFKNAKTDFEPDFTFINQEHNLFIDIEIDEPYSGASRKPLHYIDSYDKYRDTYFNHSGWVVIRFTEQQAVCEPQACCDFIELVVQSLIDSERFDPKSINQQWLSRTKQWTYDEAIEMANQHFRESYLGVTFEQIEEDTIIDEAYRDSGSPGFMENIFIKEYRDSLEVIKIEEELFQNISQAIRYKDYVKIRHINRVHLGIPLSIEQRALSKELVFFDLVMNMEILLDIARVGSFDIEAEPFLFHHEAPTLQIARAWIELAHGNKQYVRMRYQKSGGEQSLRTIGQIKGDYRPEESEWWFSPDTYFVGHCNLRNEERTFHFNRLTELWILNLEYT